MMHLQEIQAHPSLAQFVRFYRIIDFEFNHNQPIPPKAYTPRPEHCLQFFSSPTLIEYPGKPVIKPKNALLIGQHTLTNQRTVYKRFLSLQIIFQPGALYRLFGLPMSELSDLSIEAGDFFGAEIEQVNDQLYHAGSHQQMIAIADRLMLKFARQVKKDFLPLDRATQNMFSLTQSLDQYVSLACLSHRQFDRQFIHRIGIPPKQYLRIIRFDQAYRMKNHAPQKSWFRIAIDCGYHDYQHLSKDYQNFTGLTPPEFFKMDSPERSLGSEEVY